LKEEKSVPEDWMVEYGYDFCTVCLGSFSTDMLKDGKCEFDRERATNLDGIPVDDVSFEP